MGGLSRRGLWEVYPAEAYGRSIPPRPMGGLSRRGLWEAYPAEAIAQRMKDELGLTSIEFSSCELLSDAEIDAGTD